MSIQLPAEISIPIRPLLSSPWVSAQVLRSVQTVQQSKINFQPITLGFVAVAQGTYCTNAANAENVPLTERLLEWIQQARQYTQVITTVFNQMEGLQNLTL